MNFSQNKKPTADQSLDEMLLSLREEENAQQKPPVINTFRLQMEAERRRSRIQLEMVTVAAFISVLSTAVFTAFFFRFMLPDIIAHSDRRTKEFFLTFRADVHADWGRFGGIFIAIALAVLMGYIFSAVLLISHRNKIFTQKE